MILLLNCNLKTWLRSKLIVVYNKLILFLILIILKRKSANNIIKIIIIYLLFFKHMFFIKYSLTRVWYSNTFYVCIFSNLLLTKVLSRASQKWLSDRYKTKYSTNKILSFYVRTWTDTVNHVVKLCDLNKCTKHASWLHVGRVK